MKITILIISSNPSGCPFLVNDKEESIMNIGTWISRYRRKNNLSQEEFGRLVGVNKQTVSRWENGTLQPSSQLYYLISDVLRVPIEVLMNNEHEEMEFLPVYKNNKKYDVGLNAVFEAIKDYDTLLVFLDMIIETHRLQSNDRPVAYVLVLSDIIEDPETKENGIPIIDMKLWDDHIVMCIPDHCYDHDMIIPKTNVKAVTPRIAFNNITYVVDIIPKAKAVGKVQIVIDLEPEEER